MEQKILRSLQLHELEILKTVRDICERNNIKYYLNGGTLLGAVRHKGFIPWDDDIDIAMPYADFVHFSKIAVEEFPESLFLQNSETDKNFWWPFAKVRLNGTTMGTEDELACDMHNGIWLDIFPLVYFDSVQEYKKLAKVVFLCNFLQKENYFRANIKSENTKYSTVNKLFLSILYMIPEKIRIRLHKRMLKYVFKKRKGKYVTELWTVLSNIEPAEIYEGEPQTLEFEGEMYKVPPKYKENLTLTYGDYMQLPPEDKRCTQHGNLIIDFENGYIKN